MVSKELENTNWKKLDESNTHFLWENIKTNDILVVDKIITDILHKYYVWVVNKNDYGGIKTQFGTKKEAMDYAQYYRRLHEH